MKKTIGYSIGISIILFFFAGCDLEEKTFSAFSADSIVSDETVDILLATSYNRFGLLMTQNETMGWALELPTPSVHYQHRRNQIRANMSTWSWGDGSNPGNPAYFDLMDFHWRAIRAANDVIDLVSKSDALSDKQRQAEIIAEAKFLRAITYFYAVRLWGGMPIIDKAQTLEDELFIQRSSIAETYEFIVKGLKEAIEDLPLRSEYAARGIPAGHITKGGAKAELARAYLTMSGFPLNDNSNLAEAKTLLDEVINSGEWSLIQSATPYQDLWDWQNQNNSEMMFSIQREGNNQTWRGLTSYYAPRAFTSDVWSDGENKGIGLNGVPPEFAEWYATHDTGQRYKWTIITEIVITQDYRSPGGKTRKAGDTIKMTEGREGQAYAGKYRAKGITLNDPNFFPNDYPMLRYADVLLMHSEISNELDNQDYSGVNAIRERAGLDLLSGLSKDDFRDAVFIERDLELVFEQKMLFDMRRRGLQYCKDKLEGFYNLNQNKIGNDNSTRYQNHKAHAEMKIDGEYRLLYPIPLVQLLANPNFGDQNPGY